MKLNRRRIPAIAITVISTTGLIVFSACSVASADSAPGTAAAPTTATSAPVSTPTPTIVSNVPFPFAQANVSTGTTGNTSAVPTSESRHRERDGEGEEGGEFGEHGSTQRVTVTLTNSGLQLSTLTAPAGSIEFDLTNQTSDTHHVLISGNGVNGDSGAIAPGATAHLQGTLPAGSYQLSIDTAKNGNSSITLQLR